MSFNFIRNRKRKQQLTYMGVDLFFVVMLALVCMVIASFVISFSNDENVQVDNYLKAQINTLNKQIISYPVVKKKLDKLLDEASDLYDIKALQSYLLDGIEKISNAITDNLYVTEINYIEKSRSMTVKGEVESIKFLSVFMKNLETEFGLAKVDLKSLSLEKNDRRNFLLEFKLDSVQSTKDPD